MCCPIGVSSSQCTFPQMSLLPARLLGLRPSVRLNIEVPGNSRRRYQALPDAPAHCGPCKPAAATPSPVAASEPGICLQHDSSSHYVCCICASCEGCSALPAVRPGTPALVIKWSQKQSCTRKALNTKGAAFPAGVPPHTTKGAGPSAGLDSPISQFLSLYVSP